MTTYRGRDGQSRLWLSDWQIELIAEDALRKAGLTPTVENPVVDIERLLEKYLGAELDLTADLAPDVLGQTSFELSGETKVEINRNLTGEMEELETIGVLGRWRATLAHEGGHILLHRHLFVVNPLQGRLLPSEPRAETLMRCFRAAVSFSPQAYDWREFQANRAMADLLMPAPLFRELTRNCLQEIGLSEEGPIQAGSKVSIDLASALASMCNVSRAAASIRLTTLGFVVSSPMFIMK